jgi:hypothetical protein
MVLATNTAGPYGWRTERWLGATHSCRGVPERADRTAYAASPMRRSKSHATGLDRDEVGAAR